MIPRVRALAAAGLLFLASCAVAPLSPVSVPPDVDTVRSRLLQDEAATHAVRGLARVEVEGSRGSGSASEVVVVALPDRARMEALTPLGTTALVATLRARELRVHSLLRHEYVTGRATRETLGRLIKVPVPPEPFLRLLAGLPPLPIRGDDPRLTIVPDGSTIRVESVDGEYWQRLWTGADDPAVERGEVGRASEVLFAFTFLDRRPTEGRSFPFEVRVEESAAQSRLRVQYERMQLNPPVDPDLFELPPPTDPQTRIIRLDDAAPGKSPRD
jgi:hypothetical protein